MATKQTAVGWFYDKIKSHFEHDGDLLETLIFTYSIAKQKEKEQLIGLLQWMNKVAESNPMALETTNEDVVEMYLNGDYEQ